MLLAVGYHYVAEREPAEPRAIFPVTTAALAAQVELLGQSFELVSRDDLMAAAESPLVPASKHAGNEGRPPAGGTARLAMERQAARYGHPFPWLNQCQRPAPQPAKTCSATSPTCKL